MNTLIFHLYGSNFIRQYIYWERMPPKSTKKSQKSTKSKQAEKQPNKIQQKQKQNQWPVIQNMNQLYKVDRILLKHAYDHYPQLATLENSHQFHNIEKFYRYTLDNLDKIEKDYLMDQVNIGDHTNYNLNKNSTSKFIRDQREHYDQIFKQMSQKINQDQYAINGNRLYNFVKQCFQTKYTKVLIKGQEYFQKDTHMKQFEQRIKQYSCNSNGVDQNAYRIENVWLSGGQILDFLTYWLKSNQNNQFYILYCRTEQKLKKEIHYLKTQAKNKEFKQARGQKFQPTYHPVTLNSQQISKTEQQIIGLQKMKNQEIKQQIVRQVEQEKQQSNNSNNNNSKITNILERYRNNKFFQQPKIEQKVKQLSKKQQLMIKLPELFITGCKRRYPTSKGTTFDQIQSQSKTMNLQKFLNFCKYYGINTMLSRQLLTEIFKMNAINRLTIDEGRFVKIISTIIQTDANTMDKLLCKKQTKKKLKSEGRLSNYKYALIPIKGKDPESLEKQIEQKKLMKSKEKQQKLNLYFLKKMKQKQRSTYRKQKAVNSSKILPESTNIIELENIRDDHFDPKKFFTNEPDELLSQYQSKLQNSKDAFPSSLQTILSRRLQKGNKILQKINSSKIKNYE